MGVKRCTMNATRPPTPAPRFGYRYVHVARRRGGRGEIERLGSSACSEVSRIWGRRTTHHRARANAMSPASRRGVTEAWADSIRSVGPVSDRALLCEDTRNMGYPVVLAMLYHDVLRASSETGLACEMICGVCAYCRRSVCDYVISDPGQGRGSLNHFQNAHVSDRILDPSRCRCGDPLKKPIRWW